MGMFTLSPESIRTASLVILNLSITLYIASLPRKEAATRALSLFTGSIAFFYAMRFIQGSSFPLPISIGWGNPWLLAETVVTAVAMGAYVFFAYTFISAPYKRECRYAMLGYVLLTLADPLFNVKTRIGWV